MAGRSSLPEVVAEHVASGYRDGRTIARRVRAYLSLPVAAEPEIAREVEQAIAVKRAAIAAWPPETDCDRLDRAFAALWADRIIALQNAGFTRSDGHESVDDEARAHPAAWGYCFFHQQDLERAVRNQGLALAFGVVRPGERDDADAGRAVCAALVAAGLAPVWSGEPRQRIALPTLVWRRRGPEVGVALRREAGARAAHFSA